MYELRVATSSSRWLIYFPSLSLFEKLNSLRFKMSKQKIWREFNRLECGKTEKNIRRYMEFNKRVEIPSSVERMVLHGGSKLEEADTFIACDRVWSWILKCELCMYHEIFLHHRFYLFRGLVAMLKPFSAETRISTGSTPRSCRNFCHIFGLKIALILLLRHLWTLNFSSLKQRKGNNIYKLTQTWNSLCSSYKYSMWQRTNVRTLRVCLQQRSSKVTWNYTCNTWNLTLRRWINS